MTWKTSLVCILCTLVSGIASAVPEQNAATTTGSNKLDVSGYVDASYNYLSRSNKFTSGIPDRVYDLAQNGFTLQQAELSLAKQPPEGFGWFTDFVLGRDAFDLSPAGFNPNLFSKSDIGFTIPQAYLQYAVDGTIFSLGEQQTPAGYEQYQYNLDQNFSRSILYGFAQPGLHVGLHITRNLTEKLQMIGVLANGWNTIKKPFQLDTLELALIYNVASQFSFTLDGYAGRQSFIENSESGPTSNRYVVDAFGTWKATDKLSFSVNVDYGTQIKAALPYNMIGRAFWHGIAGYASYQLTERWMTVIRAEHFNDTQGYRTGAKQNLRELTFTLGFTPIKNLQFRAETRHDISNVNAFKRTNPGASNNLQSYALEVFYIFA